MAALIMYQAPCHGSLPSNSISRSLHPIRSNLRPATSSEVVVSCGVRRNRFFVIKCANGEVRRFQTVPASPRNGEVRPLAACQAHVRRTQVRSGPMAFGAPNWVGICEPGAAGRSHMPSQHERVDSSDRGGCATLGRRRRRFFDAVHVVEADRLVGLERALEIEFLGQSRAPPGTRDRWRLRRRWI